MHVDFKEQILLIRVISKNTFIVSSDVSQEDPVASVTVIMQGQSQVDCVVTDVVILIIQTTSCSMTEFLIMAELRISKF